MAGELYQILIGDNIPLKQLLIVFGGAAVGVERTLLRVAQSVSFGLCLFRGHFVYAVGGGYCVNHLLLPPLCFPG